MGRVKPSDVRLTPNTQRVWVARHRGYQQLDLRRLPLSHLSTNTSRLSQPPAEYGIGLPLVPRYLKDGLAGLINSTNGMVRIDFNNQVYPAGISG